MIKPLPPSSMTELPSVKSRAKKLFSDVATEGFHRVVQRSELAAFDRELLVLMASASGQQDAVKLLESSGGYKLLSKRKGNISGLDRGKKELKKINVR